VSERDGQEKMKKKRERYKSMMMTITIYKQNYTFKDLAKGALTNFGKHQPLFPNNDIAALVTEIGMD
jgi:hypothetical protein